MPRFFVGTDQISDKDIVITGTDVNHIRNVLRMTPGESIGQVASQTMQSLRATNAVCTLPVYRPVIGFDKNDIVEISEKIGAFETSIQPFEDCCTIFVAKHPVTKPNVRAIERSEHHLVDVIDELLKTAIETRETILCE